MSTTSTNTMFTPKHITSAPIPYTSINSIVDKKTQSYLRKYNDLHSSHLMIKWVNIWTYWLMKYHVVYPPPLWYSNPQELYGFPSGTRLLLDLRNMTITLQWSRRSKKSFTMPIFSQQNIKAFSILFRLHMVMDIYHYIPFYTYENVLTIYKYRINYSHI